MMKFDAPLFFGVICAVFAILILVMVAVQQPFPVFNSSNQTDSFVDVTKNVGSEDSRFMWNNDGLALIAQAIALFAAAAATLCLLKIDEEKP